MKVCLIAPITRRREPPRNYPMGLAYIASVLLNEGHEVEVLDLDINRHWSDGEREEKIRRLNCDVVGIGGLITTYRDSKTIVEQVKHYHPETKVVIGGRMAASCPELWLEKTPADFVVEGEGEITAVELLRAIEQGEDYINVKGIWYKEGEKFIRTLPREYIPDLDQLPRPAYDLFDLEAYIANWKDWVRGARPVMMITCRGCVVLCSFCYQGFGGFRQRSVENFTDEVEFLVGQYGIDTIFFGDSTLMVNKKFVEGFCNELLRRKIRLRWYGASRVSDIGPKHRDLLRLMREAGCQRLHFGVESGSPKILKGIKKGTTVEAAEQAIRLAREAGLIVHSTYIYGLPGETRETVQETVDFCRRNLTPTSFFFATPYPETELYSQALGSGKIVDEEEFISRLGDVDQYTVNLSEIPDDEFVPFKNRMEKATRIPIPVYLYRYWRNYGTANLLRYLAFAWENYTATELAGRILNYFRRKPKSVVPAVPRPAPVPLPPTAQVKDAFPIS